MRAGVPQDLPGLPGSSVRTAPVIAARAVSQGGPAARSGTIRGTGPRRSVSPLIRAGDSAARIPRRGHHAPSHRYVVNGRSGTDPEREEGVAES